MIRVRPLQPVAIDLCLHDSSPTSNSLAYKVRRLEACLRVTQMCSISLSKLVRQLRFICVCLNSK